MLKEVYYLQAILLARGVVKRHLAMAQTNKNTYIVCKQPMSVEH